MKCIDCGSTKEIQVHHSSYEPEITEILCRVCHLAKHPTHGVGRAIRKTRVNAGLISVTKVDKGGRICICSVRSILDIKRGDFVEIHIEEENSIILRKGKPQPKPQPPILLECFHCKKTFFRYQSKMYAHNFCSRSCYNKFKKGEMVEVHLDDGDVKIRKKEQT